jgi:hypothetical protein
VSCNLRIFVLAALAIGTLNTTVSATPTPIIRDANGNWIIDSSATFAQSAFTLDVRKFAGPFPNNSNGSRPRLNSLSYAPGSTDLFVINAGEYGDATSEGLIYRVSANGTIENGGAPLVDVSDFFTLPRGSNWHNEQGGVRSLSFHPEFDQIGMPGYGKAFTTQSVSRASATPGVAYLGPMNPTLQNNGNGAARVDGSVVEWTATFGTSGEVTGFTSPREVYRVATPSAQHPIKEASFNPLAVPGDEDYGLLYVLHPDGGAFSMGTGLNPVDALGKVVRVNPLADGVNPYSVPSTNPFVGVGEEMLDEVFAYGFRDQHTIAFAPGANVGDAPLIFVTDIGADRVDEIDVVAKGGNYGWNNREGTINYPSGATPTGTDSTIYPVAQYGHAEPNSHAIAGGYVLNAGIHGGQFIFDDFTNNNSLPMVLSVSDALTAVTDGTAGLENIAPAEIKTVAIQFDHDNNPETPSIAKTSFLDIVNDDPNFDGSGRTDLRFGMGPDGTLFLLNKRNGYIYTATLQYPEFLPGDTNGDGLVDMDDYAEIASRIGGPPVTPGSLGDIVADGVIDLKDFALWQQNRTDLGGVSGVQVPEPSTLALAIGVLLVAGQHRRRRQNRH